MSVNYSQSIVEIASSAYRWPETTKPWVVANALVHSGEDASIQTFCGGAGQEFVSSLSFAASSMLDITCFTVAGGRWEKRRITEVLLGTLGEAVVAVFRDNQGVDFCPDAPTLPVSQLSGLTLICAVDGHQPVERPPLTEGYGKRIYRAVLQDIQGRSNTKTAAQAVSTQSK